MAKFYVWCGKTELVLTSQSRPSAALGLMDRILTPHLWIYDDPDLSERDCLEHLMLEALLHLPTEIHLSERGFESPDRISVSVPETIQRWHALMVGMRRLFVAAGLNRSVAVLAGANALSESATKGESRTVRRLPK